MNKIYKTLYSRDNLGNIRVWWCEQENEKYRMCSGIKDSENIVKSEWTICEGKNTGNKG